MTFQGPIDQFSSTTSVVPTFHPLANPHVLSVIPFWVCDDLYAEPSEDDVINKDELFDDSFELKDNALLSLDISELNRDHGERIAETLYGRTGLFVIVDNLDAIRKEVSGKILSDASCNDDLIELVVETPASITIFVQKVASSTMRLAA